MAIVKNFWLVNQKKKLGGAVIYQAMGQTRSRELAASVSNPRTQAQMQQRVKWANLVNFYRANASWMKFAYETKKTNQSEYNKFMSLNVPSSRIYIPKTLAAQGACIVDAYSMTQGSLASIEITPSTNKWLTNIFLGNDYNLSPNATVGEVSQVILSYNPAIREGDQISFIRFTQLTNSSTGVPYVVVRKYEVVINSSDARMFFSFMPVDYITDGVSGGQSCLAVADSGASGGFVLVLSRTTGGRTYVSTQDIVVANNESIIAEYSSQSALQAAIDSYGESSEPFLTSTIAEEDNQANVPTSMVSVKVDDVAYPLGQVAFVPTLTQDASIDIKLSSEPPATSVIRAKLYVMKGGQEAILNISSPEVNGADFSGALAMSADLEGYWLSEVRIMFGDTEYRGVWFLPNAAYIEGLE